MLNVLGAAVARGAEQAQCRGREVGMGEDRDAAQREEGRQRARAGLPFILADRVRSTKRQVERDPWEQTPEQVRKKNNDRQVKARRVAAARRRRLLAGDDVEETPLDTPMPTPAERRAVDPARRADTTRDALLERTVRAEPAYVRLVALCEEEAATPSERLRTIFVMRYCRELEDLRGGTVSTKRVGELASELPQPRSDSWAYESLTWAYRLFSEWAVLEHLKGHIFTEEEIAPMRVWLRGVPRRSPDTDDADRQ